MSKKPFDPNISYGNGLHSENTKWNICYYDHDAGYSRPEGRTRSQVDKECSLCLKLRAFFFERARFLTIIIPFGWIRWRQCRARDQYRN